MVISKTTTTIKNLLLYIGLIILTILIVVISYYHAPLGVWLKNLLNKTKKQIVDVSKLPFINKVKENQNEFGLKVFDIAFKLKTKAEFLMIIMNNESGLNHKAKNPNSSATGLIQFMHATAIGLGTTTDKLKMMSNIEQLDWVYKYLKKYTGKFNSVSDVYLAVFFPLALYKDEDYVFPKWASDANPNFDLNKDKIGTKKEFRTYVNNKYAKYLI